MRKFQWSLMQPCLQATANCRRRELDLELMNQLFATLNRASFAIKMHWNMRYITQVIDVETAVRQDVERHINCRAIFE